MNESLSNLLIVAAASQLIVAALNLKPGPSLIHATLLVLYGGLAAVYLWAAA